MEIQTGEPKEAGANLYQLFPYAITYAKNKQGREQRIAEMLCGKEFRSCVV
jgi:hypothetical protein